MEKKARILITTGDPDGIGPEITKKALDESDIKNLADFLVIQPDERTGLSAIKKAVQILLNRKAEGIVTAPVNKSKIIESDVPFIGHTEYFADATHTKDFCMMFCGGNLKVSLVTRHIALKDVHFAISEEKIIETTNLTFTALKRYFKIHNPKIGICGLNPHCGESGNFGNEEKDIIVPAINKLKSRITGVTGPIPADVIFYRALNGKLDAVISMYHDQGLAPFKMLYFENGVNVTLGLPFVRTSPDHGTAYDIAGKGIANPTAMKDAIKLAVKMCKEKESYHGGTEGRKHGKMIRRETNKRATNYYKSIVHCP